MHDSCRTSPGASPLRWPWWLALVGLLTAGSGCVVEERVWWSPDGSVAAVDGRPGLRLMRPDGALTKPILDGSIHSVCWLPDGSGLVVARALEVATWDEAKPLLPKEEVQAIEAAASIVPALLRTLRAMDQLPEDGGGFFRPPTDELKLWAVFHFACARDRHGDAMQAAIRANGLGCLDLRGSRDRKDLSDDEVAEEWRELQKEKMEVWDLSVMPIANGAAAGPVRSLLRSVRPLSFPVASPRGEWVAVRLGGANAFESVFMSPAQTHPSLVAIDLKSERRVEVADNVSSNPVWLADGVSLAYVTAESGASGPAGIKTLRRKTLVADGPDTMKAGEDTPLMMGLFPTVGAGTRLAALPGDRLLVPAAELTLPFRSDTESPPRARLYIVDAAVNSKAPPVPVNTAANALPENLGSFAVSPDGTRAAVVEHASNAVAVVDLATGRVDPVVAATGNAKCGTLPAWRNDRELLIQTRRPNGGTRDTWAIWQRGKPLRWLDDTWSDREKEYLPRIQN